MQVGLLPKPAIYYYKSIIIYYTYVIIAIINIIIITIVIIIIPDNIMSTLQVVLARAEALAKAQFARSRDAHECALMYVALEKKQLLLVCILQQAF